MTVAIKRENGDLIWFDAVLSFGRQFSGSVSKHPLEDGAVITDHTTIDNEVITLSGVLSDADFNLNRPIISSQEATTLGLQNKQFVNNTPVSQRSDGSQLYQNVFINESSGLADFLPESIGQFFGSGAPSVDVPSVPKTKVADQVKDDLIAMFEKREKFVLLDFVEQRLSKPFANCVMTSLNFLEDPDSGFAVYPVMTIERVKFASSTSVKIRKQVSPEVEKKAAAQQNLGKQASVGGTTTEDVGTDKETNSSQLVQQIKAATD
ncbi:hypothetical protein D3C85_584990 [compost metagenome]